MYSRLNCIYWSLFFDEVDNVINNGVMIQKKNLIELLHFMNEQHTDYESVEVVPQEMIQQW